MPHSHFPERSKGRAPDPRNAEVRAVLARSGNQCAFPGCPHPIVNEQNQFIAQVCHIEAAAPGGPRFNLGMTDEARRSTENLLILCYRHHVETDDVGRFSAADLRAMKRSHESQFIDKPFAPDASVLAQISRETSEYWAAVDRANSEEHVVPDLRIEIDASAQPLTLVDEIRHTLRSLGRLHGVLTESSESLAEEIRSALLKCGYGLRKWDALVGYENPVRNRDWEWINLGLPNHMGRISVLVDQLEIRLLEAAVIVNPSDLELRQRFETCRAAFLEGSRSWGVVD